MGTNSRCKACLKASRQRPRSPQQRLGVNSHAPTPYAGMWGLVRKIAPAFRTFANERRQRVNPHHVDPQAYGADGNPDNRYGIGGEYVDAVDSRGISGAIGNTAYRPRRVRKLASWLLLASGVVLAMNTGGSSAGKSEAKRRKYRSRLPSMA